MLTPTQRAGLLLAGWTGIAALACILIILIEVVVALSRLPSNPFAGEGFKLPPATRPADVEIIATAYKSLNETVLDRTTRLFDAVVTKTLLPVFTLLLGYIFGTRSDRNPDG